ncbi:hypothetical protein QJR26_10095 [Clostridium baratii]
MLYFILFILFIGFYNSDFGKFLRFIFTVFSIQGFFENILTNFSLSFTLFIFIIFFNLPIIFKIFTYFIKRHML